MIRNDAADASQVSMGEIQGHNYALCLNGRDDTLGIVLSQQQGVKKAFTPAPFSSCKLTPAEQNYETLKHKPLAIRAAFREWHHYLEGLYYEVQVLMGHWKLEYIWKAT